MIRRLAEGLVFAAIAIALHLAVFWFKSDDMGQTAGGAGGGSSVTMAGANAEMAEMIADWDDAPDPDLTVDEMMPEQPDQPEDITADQMMLPVFEPAADAPEPPQTPTTVTPLTETPVVAALPVPAPTLQQPQSIEAPMITAPTIPRAGLAVPTTPTAPPPPKMAAPLIEPDPTEPPEPEVAENAPATAPIPQKKPKPPKREVAKAATVKPKAPKPKAAKPKTSKPQPSQKAPSKTTAEDATGGDSAEAAPASVAFGVGGGTEAGVGTAAKAAGLSASQRASLEQAWGGKIRRSVEKKKRYPRSSRRSGATQIAMIVSRTGGLIAANVKRGSGFETLDKAAMKAVKAAAPYAPAPGELDGDSFTFVLSILFKR